jgi:hypothetical protein
MAAAFERPWYLMSPLQETELGVVFMSAIGVGFIVWDVHQSGTQVAAPPRPRSLPYPGYSSGREAKWA